MQPEHLLKTLIEDDSGVVKNLIRSAGGRPEEVLSGAETLLAKMPSVEGSGAGQLHLSPNLAKILDQAEQAMKKSGDACV